MDELLVVHSGVISLKIGSAGSSKTLVDGTNDYGGPIDKWNLGASLTPADVNAGNMKVAFVAAHALRWQSDNADAQQVLTLEGDNIENPDVNCPHVPYHNPDGTTNSTDVFAVPNNRPNVLPPSHDAAFSIVSVRVYYSRGNQVFYADLDASGNFAGSPVLVADGFSSSQARAQGFFDSDGNPVVAWD